MLSKAVELVDMSKAVELVDMEKELELGKEPEVDLELVVCRTFYH